MTHLSVLGLVCHIVLCLCATTAQAASRPHIILIVADDLGYNDVSFHGSNQIPTPNIDGLAYGGVLLNNYYVSPICTPTRSALMTGRHPIHTGMQHNVIVGTQPYGLPLNETLMPQLLNDLGYRSKIVGKWHLGMHKWEYTPTHRGFESHIGYYQGCADYYTHTYEGDLEAWGLDFRRDEKLLWNYTGLYSTDVFREEAVNIIHTHNTSQPLFLYLPFQAVHSGDGDGPHLQAPQRYIEKFSYIENHDRRLFAAMTGALDDAVGEIYDALRNTGMLDNSIIVFTTDNGGPSNGFDFNAASNYPLRGVKYTMWEGGVRGVGLVHSPLLQTQGYVADQMLHVCDWLPTLYAAAGGDPSTLANLDGFNAWDMLSKNGTAVRSEMLHNIDPVRNCAGLRVGDYKLVLGDMGVAWDGWYPPYQLEGDERLLHVENFPHNFSEPVGKQLYRQTLHEKYASLWKPEVVERIEEIRHHKPHTDKQLRFESERPKSGPIGGKPVKINCGPKPANASSNCHPQKFPCLFHIPSDPCEYNNVADLHPDKVFELLDRLMAYRSTMVKPANQPPDDRGNPKYHGGAWVPWLS